MGSGRRRYASGLTLLEMMVVLMIAGMALALGYQSLAQWRRAETSIAGLGGDLRQQRLAQQWFESSLRGLLPVESAAFVGDAARLSGVTTRPVLAIRRIVSRACTERINSACASGEVTRAS